MNDPSQVSRAWIKSPSYSVCISGFLVLNFLHHKFKSLSGAS